MCTKTDKCDGLSCPIREMCYRYICAEIWSTGRIVEPQYINSDVLCPDYIDTRIEEGLNGRFENEL